ncbi:MAG TPA: hypothetical protein VFA16_17815 [Mycobacterium sp.]|uniref:hypothetical protein n=1 Tax=Mycobacterium sp. TaxID=1785 RepID=UPI002D4A28AE|nr:hypothetical protein [Mycobacterium sp.]HZU49089.1 hypothetical protein [Mycobacterium sp.]
MRRAAISRAVTWVVSAVALVLLICLAVLALHPSAAQWLPGWLRWFGGPGSWPTIALVVAVLAALCTLGFRSGGSHRLVTVPFTVITGLVTVSAVLGFSSYWNCHDPTHPAFFTPLVWVASLVKGGTGDFALGGHVCPNPTPAALVVARLAALAAIFTGLGGVVVTLFRSQVDRLRANLAESVTAIVGIDEDSQPMVSAIARTLDRRSTLVVITGSADEPAAHKSRAQGARVLAVDLNTPASLEALPLWRHLGRLYLMSADPATNLSRLDVISRALSADSSSLRVPLIVRIDDPWLAEAWRAQQFGGSDTRWAADVVGKYEVTARWLLDNIVEAKTIERVFVCGASQLTLALCADLTRRCLERNYYSAPGEAPLPALTLVGTEAEEYRQDHEFYLRQSGFVSSGPAIDAVAEAPTLSTLMRLLEDGGAENCAVIFVDDQAGGPTTGTRLAARFPAMPIYSWDPNARIGEEPLQIVGRLQPYGLALDMPEGQAQDAWERAARLIHERYVATLDPDAPRSPAALPWEQLDDFYRGSNRRQVRNALWMVEQIAGHTWNTWGSPAAPLSARDMAGLPPLEQLARMGFDRDSALKMAKAEHEDWCRYYRRAGWKYGPTRDDQHRIHDKLVDWSVVEGKPDLLNAAVTSLAATLWSLRQLGYRSRPLWQPFVRSGTVTAEQRSTPWTWTSKTGDTMRANAGDWAVHQDGETWSVNDEIFRATYEHVGGRTWRRRGRVLARPAQPGEKVETLEGCATASEHDWVVRGADGEEWPVSGDVFAQRYTELHPSTDAETHDGGE